LVDQKYFIAPGDFADSVLEGRARAPEVIVVISCYNYQNFVREAVLSVSRQTYQRLRCVVVDDGSADDSRAVIEGVLGELDDARFSRLALDQNAGQLQAFRLALEGRPGHLVAFLDADDYWMPRFLECHVRAHLNSIRSAPVSGSDALVIDRDNVAVEGTFSSLSKPRTAADEFVGCELPEDACPAIQKDSIVVGAGPPLKVIHVPRNYLSWHWVNTSSMVFRRDFIDLALPQDGQPKERHADYFLAYLAQILGGSLIVPQALGVYRMHGKNLFATLPRIGGRQITGIEPPGALRHTHERLVIHIMRNWSLLEALVGPQVLVHGLRRFMPWRELDGLADRNDISADIRRAIAESVKSARAEAKRGLARFAVKHLGF
jgi:glycosyltransferase involved in cell wall biosynthesis